MRVATAMDVRFGCRVRGCVASFPSSKSLKTHIVRYHLATGHCTTCGLPFNTASDFMDHFANGGCVRPQGERRGRPEAELDEHGGPSAMEAEEGAAYQLGAGGFASEPAFVVIPEAVARQEPVWGAAVLNAAGEDVRPFPLEETGLDAAMLDALIADDLVVDGQPLSKRLTSVTDMQMAFSNWLAGHKLGSQKASEVPLFAQLAQLVATDATSTQQGVFQWLSSSLRPNLGAAAAA